MSLTTLYPLWLAPLCLLLGVLYAWVLYQRGNSALGWGRPLVLALALMRCLAVSFLAFFLLGPVVRSWVREVRKPIVVIAHDGSASVANAGDTAALAKTYRPGLEELAASLGERYDVRTFTYGNVISEGLIFDQKDNRTDLAQLLREVHDRFAGPDLGAVILDGDGIVNRGRDPRHEADRLAVAVHTIALGDTTVRPDLLIRSLEANRIAYLGNELPILVQVEAHHLTGERTRIRVAQEEQTLVEKELVINADPYQAQVPLLVKAARPGIQRFTVTVLPLPGEHTEQNNTAEVVVQVLDDRQQVLLLGEAPHPDLGAIRKALEGSEAYAVTSASFTDFSGEVNEYDLVVLHRLPSIRQNAADLLLRCTQRNIPVLHVLGAGMDFQAFNALGRGVQVQGGQRTTTDAQPLFDPAFSLFQVEPTTAQVFERFPPLQVPFGQYQQGAGAVSLFKQRIGMVRTDQPLILVQQSQTAARSATICGEGLWRWRLADQQQNNNTETFDLLVRKLVQLLANRSNAERFRIVHEDVFDDQAPVILNAELYDPAFELVNTPEALITLTDESGAQRPLAFSRSGKAYRLAVDGLSAGRYTYTATTALSGTAFTAKGEFLVRPVLLEQARTVADHRLLADLSASTGGIMIAPNGLAALRDTLDSAEGMASRSYAYASTSDLISQKWPFFVLLALLALEWFLRRRNGAY
ncbi:MAG: hypothetical protein IPK99_05295 [Flavobacteriales bacterium]|nr:hypothetical protein [Flavobacteriales bacterium]